MALVLVTPRSRCARTCTPTALLTLATLSRVTNTRCAAGASSSPAERRRAAEAAAAHGERRERGATANLTALAPELCPDEEDFYYVLMKVSIITRMYWL